MGRGGLFDGLRYRLEISRFDGWRLNFSSFDGWRLIFRSDVYHTPSKLEHFSFLLYLIIALFWCNENWSSEYSYFSTTLH